MCSTWGRAMNASGEIRAGQSIGKYSILRELGRGSMGVVYLVEDSRLRRNVALKVLSGALSHDEGFRERFQLEARSIAGLIHPNIVRVHTFETLDEWLAIEMEFVEGGSLADTMSSKGLTVGETARFAYQVLDALRCCHEEGLIHRDIKPTNILLDRYGNAKLTDFGLATLLEGHLELSMRGSGSSVFFMGTPRYAAPEAWDSVTPSPSWDIYSLGMVMYEAVTGATPYRAMTPMALVKEMATRHVVPLQEAAPQVSAEFADVVSAMIAHEVDLRLSDAGEVMERLRQVPEFAQPADSRAVTIVARKPQQPSTMRRRLTKGLRRLRLSPYLGFAAGILVTAILAFWLLPGSGQRNTPRNADGVQHQVLPTEVVRPETQSTQFWDTLPSVESLPALSREDFGNAAVYDVWLQDTDVNYPAALLALNTTTDDGSMLAFAAFEGTIWGMEIHAESDTLRVEGGWATYEGLSGNTLRMGRIEGSAQWVSPHESLLMSLEFADDQTNAKWRAPVSLKRTEPAQTDAAFLLRFEALPMQQPLLYNELLPRQLDWALALDARMPALAGARTKIPRLEPGSPEAMVDGRLDEPVWSRRFLDESGTIGVLSGVPTKSGARMSLHASEVGLQIGILLPARKGSHVRVTFALCRGFSIPKSATKWWRAEYDTERGLTADRLIGDRVQKWSCDWMAASQAADDGVTVEVSIPFAGMGANGDPVPREQWRLNCIAQEVDGPTEPVTLAIWGYPEPNQVEHGAILEF